MKTAGFPDGGTFTVASKPEKFGAQNFWRDPRRMGLLYPGALRECPDQLPCVTSGETEVQLEEGASTSCAVSVSAPVFKAAWRRLRDPSSACKWDRSLGLY